MANVWTHGVWTVEPGREDEFVAAWLEMAEQGLSELNAVRPPTLLRDRDQRNVFISSGPWPSIDEVNRFRSSAVFLASRERMDGLLQSFETRTLDEVYARD